MAAWEDLTLAKTKFKHDYDKKINPYTFNKGNHMYLLKQSQKGKLNSHQYPTSYLIIDKINNHNVKLVIEKKCTEIVHEDKFKKANIKPRKRICIPIPNATII